MKLKLCEIVSNLDKVDMDKIETVLKLNPAIRDWAYIVHNKDVDVTGSAKADHIHVAIRLKDSYDTKYVSDWFGIPEQFIGKCKGRWADMLAYLTHSNAAEKYQYDDEEVRSNFDWKKEVEKKDSNKRKLEIINGIVDGVIREYNYFEHITIEEYVTYKNSIDSAYKYRADKLKGVHRDMECMFITGGSGTGKTTYAKQVALGNGFTIFVSSGSNDILDGYKGEDCIILDDLRPSSMGLSDLLKMLDNNTSSSVKSRYRNKVLECKMIIITSVLPLEKFYSGVFADQEEPIEQFKRRCKMYVEFTRDYMHLKYYDDYTRDYIEAGTAENPVKMLLPDRPVSVDEARSIMTSMLNMNIKFLDDHGDKLFSE